MSTVPEVDQVTTDLANLSINDKHSLKPVKALSVEAAEALRHLAWEESMHAVLKASETQASKVSNHSQVITAAREAWIVSSGSLGKEAHAPRGEAQPNICEAIAAAAEDIAVHAVAWSIKPYNPELAKARWGSFAKHFEQLEEAKVLHEDLLESVKWLLWNAAWCGCNIHNDKNKEEEEEEWCEEEEVLFGDDYPGSQQDSSTDMANYLRHCAECRGVNEPIWSGVNLRADSSVQDVHRAVKVGFNAVRVQVPPDAKDARKFLPLLEAARSLGAACIVDLMAWDVAATGFAAAVRELLSHTGLAALLEGGGIALPQMLVTGAQVKETIAHVRASGYSAGRCSIILQLTDRPVDEDEEFHGELKELLAFGAGSVLFQDGDIVLEVKRLEAKGLQVQQMLDEVAHCGENVDGWLPLGCVQFSLATSSKKAETDDIVFEELAARFEASASEATHGWFVDLSDSFAKCLAGKWSWPDKDAPRVMWPHGSAHTATLVYLHGFTCCGGDYLPYPEWFQHRAKEEKHGRKKKKNKGKADEEISYVPHAGLRVVLPTAPLRPVTCFDGDVSRAWYDYLEDHDGEAEDDLDDATLHEVVVQIHALLDKEVEVVGERNVFLGGASQGCCTALHIALTYPKKLGGIIATQGHLLTRTPVPADWASRQIPVRIYHGLADETMPWKDWVEGKYARLTEFATTKVVLDEGVGHGDEHEGEWIRAFLTEMLSKKTR